MRKANIFVICIILLSFIVGIYFYDAFPSIVASHWDAKGNVNGHMSKFWGLFLLPLISLGLFFLVLFLVKIDPLNKNIAKFMNYFDFFIVVLFLFLFYIHILTITWNLGFKFDMILFLLPAFAVLFYFLGVLIENSKRNWSIGIRTPWTLSSDFVWDKTHRLGGLLFKIVSFVVLFSVFVKDFSIIILISFILLISVFLIVYSYIEYKKDILSKNKLKKK